MRNFMRCLYAVMFVLLLSASAWAETVQIKAQGMSDAMFGAQEKAFQDAKKRALEKYISGLKSQTEANQLLAIKQQLFDKIDDYVKEPVEIASDNSGGKTIITIQSQIDVTAINNVAEKSFNKERKKAGVKKKQIAFVFVAREIDTVTTVKDHNINESVDNSVSSTDESRDRAAKGNSKSNAARKSTQNNDDDVAVTGDSASSRDDRSRLAQKENAEASGQLSRKGRSTESLGLKGNKRRSTNDSGEGKLEEAAEVSAEDTGAVESGKRDASSRGKYAAKGASATDSQEDIDMKADMAHEFASDESFNASGASSLNSDKAVREDHKDKYKQNRNVKTKNAQDARLSESSDYANASSENEKNVTKTDNSKYAESKNTSIQHAEERTYRVVENGTISTLLSEIFTDNGLKVSESFESADLLLKLQKAKSVNQLRPADLKQAIATAQAEGTDYLCIGTLDVDREMIDKATGNVQRYVLVNANTYDLTKQKLEKAGAVGNLNFSGLGENAEVAKNNALNNAAKEAATKLVAQIRKHMLEDDDD